MGDATGLFFIEFHAAVCSFLDDAGCICAGVEDLLGKDDDDDGGEDEEEEEEVPYP